MMFERLKANILFHQLMKRHDIDRAYAMVKEEDPWYPTIRKVHESLDEIRKLPHDTVQIVADDGARLKGIYYPCEDGVGITVICVHGYTSHAEREWAYPGLFYHALGFNVLIPYQRAHGPSEGKYISFGALEHRDVMRWVERINEMDPETRIVIHGLSMGGGIVLDLAEKEMKNVGCLIADAPTTSIEGLFRDVSKHAFKKDADKVCSYAVQRFEKEFGVDISAFDRTKTVSKGRYPMLLAAGSKEGLEEVLNGLRDCAAAQTEVIILPGCDHGNGMYKQTELYQSRIKGFIFKHIKADHE